MPLFGNDRPLFGQDRDLGEVYDAGNPELDRYNQIIDMLVRAGMSNDAIEDEIRNIESRGELNDMREGSVTGALGSVDASELQLIMDSLIPATDTPDGGIMNPDSPNFVIPNMKDTRKRLSPERIHNLGILYGEPLSRERINFFEDQLNRDSNQSYLGQFPEFPR